MSAYDYLLFFFWFSHFLLNDSAEKLHQQNLKQLIFEAKFLLLKVSSISIVIGCFFNWQATFLFISFGWSLTLECTYTRTKSSYFSMLFSMDCYTNPAFHQLTFKRLLEYIRLAPVSNITHCICFKGNVTKSIPCCER